MSCIIFTDQHDPKGRTIHYNVDKTTRAVAQEFNAARAEDAMLEIPHEDGDEPIFVNPDHVATVSPPKED